MTPSMPVGFPNVGNTCWLSALLQLLFSSDRFTYLLQKLPVDPRSTPVTHALRTLPQSISVLFALLQAKFQDYGQQDSCEGLLILLDLLHNEHATTIRSSGNRSEAQRQLLMHTQNSFSPIYALFQGVTQWLDSDRNMRYEPFLTLFTEIPNTTSNRYHNILPLHTILRESLTKQRITTLPSILIFSIPRTGSVFSNLEYELCPHFTLCFKSKQVETRQTRSVRYSIRYHLKGVVLHAGSQMFGHYTALRQTEISSNGRLIQAWFYCDDHNINPLPELPKTVRQVPRLLLYEEVREE
jgi:ubiquitin C-terminal hydrolase